MASDSDADADADEATVLSVLHIDSDVDQENNRKLVHEPTQTPQEQHYYLESIKATLTIRQLPSRGLSFQIWPAAASLISFIDRNPSSFFVSDTRNSKLRVLELGSGTGLVGIAAAAALGAAVTITDLPHVLHNLSFNAEANADAIAARGGSVIVRPLSWGSGEDAAAVGGAFDVVVASDVVYYDHLFDPLLETLRLFVEGKTAFVMAHLRRWKKDAMFFRKARKRFQVQELHKDQPLFGSRVGVTIYRFTAKGT